MSILTGHHKLFTEQKYCDVIFVCKKNKTDEWTKIGAHKLALTSVSDVFETMFFGDIVENDGVSKEAEIKIEDITMETFQSLLGFIYGKEITFDCGDEALQFLYAADKYNCYDAMKFAATYLSDDADAQNSINYYENALILSCYALKRACSKVFEDKTVEVLCCPNFVNAKSETLLTIFSLECHSTTELNLVWALERYINFNKSKDSEISDKVRPALKCIRFLTLEKKDIARTSLLSEEEKKRVIDKSLEKDDGLSLSCDERGILETMKMMRKAQPVYSDKHCCYCKSFVTSSDHSIWECRHYCDEKKCKSTLKEIYDEYNHTFLPEYRASDVKKVYEAYKLAGIIKN